MQFTQIVQLPVPHLPIPLSEAGQLSKIAAEQASQDRKSYLDKLDTAQGDDVFKYLLLVKAAALDEYISQTRTQAEESFGLSKMVALVGFIFLLAAMVLAIISSSTDWVKFDVAILTAAVGTLTEFISGVVFVLYNRTLQQLNRFHDKLISTQQMSMSLVTAILVADDAKRDESKQELARTLMSIATQPA
jgi:hypothetical protein